MRCPNCGNPGVKNGKCEYCGAVFSNGSLEGNIPNEFSGMLQIGGIDFRVYLGNVEAKDISVNCGRDICGNLIREAPIIKRKFTLIEY